ncbi:hypothetical protein BN14_11131 [Rhizoctonia solani AG-1 IB]|uniref:Uncharacterized protein n=1 Tax=Thanatephorus cucumeris (strain AG1-IB / isolate 7/3/14) TaxID=1108050 RepID=M5CGZ6_THACB|nr:hypothetical protein BN14_11131 [Rhizoctonia solani AG-1 IB]
MNLGSRDPARKERAHNCGRRLLARNDNLGINGSEVLTSEVPFSNKMDLSLYGHIVTNRKRPVRPKAIVPERTSARLSDCLAFNKLKEVEEVVESDADADEMGEE